MKKTDKPSVGRKRTGHFKRTMVSGLLLLVPVVITYLVLRLLFNFADGILQPGIEAVFGRRVPGVGIILLLAMIYLAGLVAANILGRQLIKLSQTILLRVPVIGSVYSSGKQLIESFSGTATTGFKRVVFIEYPRPNTWTVGFLTGITTDENGTSLGIVYIPTAPTPNSGWVALLPVQDIYDTDLTVPVALRMVLSGGIVAPPQIRKRALDKAPGL